MVCQLQEVPVRAASNRVLDNENRSASTALGLLRGEALPSWEQLQAWPSAPHPSLSHPPSLSSDCFVKRVKMTSQEDPKRSLVLYSFFFLVLEFFSPILSDQGCLLQNSFLI